jgi:hypothetical protein
MMLELTGIDGTNPLGFVAAIGVVAAAGGRLAWVPNGGGWTPIVSLEVEDRSALVDLLHERLVVMPFAYTFADSGQLCDDFKEKKAEEGVDAKRKSRDVRVVTEAVFRAALERCADNPAEMERLAAHTCATALREGVKVRTTAVRSVSGQIRYLSNLRAIVDSCKREDIDRALFGAWHYVPDTPKLGLDPNGLVENIPCNISKLGSIAEIGAERLALEGLRGLPTSIHRGRLVTRGYDRDGNFRWALSTTPRSFRATSDLLGSKGLFGDGSDVARWAGVMGVAAVYESAVEWYGQGYKTLRPSIRAA